MISIQSVELSYPSADGQLRILENISFRVEEQSSCAIIGPSGCGKSSLLFLLAGLRKPDSGRIDIDGNPRCGTILQNYGLFPWKTVAQNVALGLTLRGERRAVLKEKVAELIDEMGLSGFERHYPLQLSGGMQQRVALARALAIDPDILFMDEPLSALDALTRERLQRLIIDIWQARRVTFLIVTHSIEEAVFLGRRIVVLGKKPATVVHIVENPEAGQADFRNREQFYRRCALIRDILMEESDGENT